jgi:hypothetical protein
VVLVHTAEYGQFRVRKDYSYLNTMFWRPGMLLIGDAACFIDPIFSSGVLAATKRDLLTFAAAVTEADNILRASATGFDLSPLYPKLPEALNGLVELGYDTSNQPLMRFIEPLAYESSIYTEARQSTYCLRLAGRTIFIGADSSGIDPMIYRYIRGHAGPVDMAFLGMECAGAPLTWLYQPLLTQPVTKRMSDSRTLSGSNAAQASAIMTELEAREAYVYAMGEEPWVGHVMATSYNDDSFQLKQADEFMTWCADHGVKAGHLYGQQEWRW